jgi:tetratricopeptide (TPR) repeat protein
MTPMVGAVHIKPPDERTNILRDQKVWLAIILLVALALRVLYILQAREHLFFNTFSDSLYYHQWALRIIEGQHGPQVFYMGPIYPYLLAFWYTLLGPQMEFILWFQVVLGTVHCFLLYLLGRWTGGTAVGLLAAFLGAIYRVEIFYEGMVLMTTMLVVLHLLLLLSLCWSVRRQRWYGWGIGGFLLGLAAIGRANVLLFLPFLCVGIFLLGRRNRWLGERKARGRRLRALMAVILGLLVVIIPVSLHNYLVGEDMVPITSNLGMNFFIGNNSRATGYYTAPKGLDLSADLYGAKIASVYAGRGLKPSEVSAFWLRKGLDFVSSHPLDWARLLLQKTLFFWNAYELPQVENLYFVKRFVPLARWPLLDFSLLGPLGLLGLVLSLRRWRQFYFPIAFVLAYFLATIPFFVISRLRLQICPALMVLASYGLVWGYRKIKTHRVNKLIWAILGTTALALLINFPLAALLHPDEHLAEAYRFYGHHLKNEGQLEAAADQYQGAIRIDPQLADSYVDLAAVRLRQGRSEEALALYQQALEVNPEVSGVHLSLGELYLRQGLWAQAIDQFRKETINSPYSLRAYQSLHRALQQREDTEEGWTPEGDSGRLEP